MPAIDRRALAALADAAAIAAFVAAGRQSHDLGGGAAWFLTVVWPFAAGWFALGLLTRLYAVRSEAWLRLTATWSVGIAAALVARVLVTGRTAPAAFIVVAYAFLGGLTFGWRALAALLARRRRRIAAE